MLMLCLEFEKGVKVKLEAKTLRNVTKESNKKQ
jgi:hypothetical protein